MKPKPHQAKAIDFAVESLKLNRRWRSYRRAAVKHSSLMTVSRMMPNRRIWILTPTVESLAAHASQSRMIGLNIAPELRDRKASRFARLCITTYATAWHRPQIIKPDDLIIFDECHHVNFRAPAISSLLHGKAISLWLSASPWSIGSKDYFPHRHIQPLSELINLGINADYSICDWSVPVSRSYQIVYTRASANHELLRGLKSSDYAICKRMNSRQADRSLSPWHCQDNRC